MSQVATVNHPDYLALLRGVRKAPDDDLPRLVLADWLEETDRQEDADRAEFIRVQIKQAKTSRAKLYGVDRLGWPGAPKFRAIRGRALELMNQYATNVALMGAHLRDVREREQELNIRGGYAGGRDQPRYYVRRGFVEWVECTQAWFVHYAKQVFDHFPITAITLSDRQSGRGANRLDAGGGHRHYWHRSLPPHSPEDHYRYQLVPDIYNEIVLNGRKPIGDYIGFPCNAPNDYTRVEECNPTPLYVLSEACIALGRKRAGLSSPSASAASRSRASRC